MSSAPRRTASTSSRPARSAAQAELPHRTRSVAVRPSNHSQPPPPPAQYAHSKTASHDHRPPSNYAAFDGVGRPDGDAKARRDRDVSAERPATARTESTRRHQRTSSMQPRENELAPVDSVPVSASGPLGPTSAPSQPKRRTTITTPTGNWALGKTIGAGSMGKVKLAKNIETGEQVIIPNPRCFPFFFLPPGWRGTVQGDDQNAAVACNGFGPQFANMGSISLHRLPSRSSLACRPRNTSPRARRSGQIAPRKFELQERLPSSL